MTDYTIFDGIQLRRDGVPPEQWPKLSCRQANQTALEDSDLRLDENREILFQGNGQLRASSDLLFLTGGSSPEKLRILANGNVGIGTTTPQAKLDVEGNLLVKGEIHNAALSAVLKELMDKLDTLQRELQTQTTEINRINTELEATKKELQNTKTELGDTKNLLDQTTQKANTALAQAQSAQNTANTAHSEIASLRGGIENGSVIAQKAVMLRARDNNHWMRCRGVDHANNDIFELWRNDNNWFSTIRVHTSITAQNLEGKTRYIVADNGGTSINAGKNALHIQQDGSVVVYDIASGQAIWVMHTANTALAKAQSAQDTADSAKRAADGAQYTADSALGKANAALEMIGRGPRHPL